MKVLKIVPLIFILILAGLEAGAQCKGFAKNDCRPQLGSYAHDGNYHAAILVEGEEAELYKTFYADMEYRVAVCGAANLPNVEFRVMDSNRNVLFSSKDMDNAKTWDFKLESSQQLKLVVKVTSFNQPGETPASGCVSIMFGFKVK
ncbi:MAG: hypothetical protein RBS37_03210 [Bacteroidales bacterium]|jgi:hypothetical protein|nr:hypothetical protein [Bacteroidales bacterium]